MVIYERESATDYMNADIAFEAVGFDAQTIFNLTHGFGVGTAVIEGESFQTCIESFNLLRSSILEVINDIRFELSKLEGFVFDQFDLWPYLLINDKIISIHYSIHGISNGCYYGAFEVWGALGDYTEFLEEPDLITTSFTTNFGFIYTVVRDLILYVQRDPRTPIKSPF
jgi:hypothetical protein